jgi:esterase/lipase
MNNTPIILLHGLCGLIGNKFTRLSLYPLKKYLEFNGYNNVHIISYPSNELTINKSVEFVSNEISNIANKEQKIIIIGQSMGGVIALNMHTMGWNIILSISIGSPLHGARLITQIENYIKNNLYETFSKYIIRMIKKQGHTELQNKKIQNPPPHKYKTISLGWFNYEFDGCVYKDEAVIDEKHNLHLPWADHRTIFINPRLWFHVHNIIDKQ